MFAVFPVTGCGVEEARNAGERAAENKQKNRQEEQQKSGEQDSPEPGTAEQAETPVSEPEEVAGDGRSGEDTSRPTAVYESNRTGIIFHFPASWETSVVPAEGIASAGSEPIDEVELTSPGGDAHVIIHVYELNKVVTESNLPEIKEQLDRLYESLAVQLGGEVEYVRDFEKGSLSGRECLIVGEDGYTVRMFSGLKGDRQYNIQLETSTEEDQEQYEAVLEEVVGSFEVLPGYQ